MFLFAFARVRVCVSQHLLLAVDGLAFQNVVLERLNCLDAVVDNPEKKRKCFSKNFIEYFYY